MSVEDLDSYVWSHMPAMKFLAGRKLVARLTRRCARQFPGSIMVGATDEGRDRVLEQIQKNVERQERANYKMGFVLTLILLGPAVRNHQSVVSVVAQFCQ
jgi:hypothetical protein